jgi:hypothetical protein
MEIGGGNGLSSAGVLSCGSMRGWTSELAVVPGLELETGGRKRLDIDGRPIGVGGGAAGAGDAGVGVTDVDGMALPEETGGCSNNRDERDMRLVWESE